MEDCKECLPEAEQTVAALAFGFAVIDPLVRAQKAGQAESLIS